MDFLVSKNNIILVRVMVRLRLYPTLSRTYLNANTLSLEVPEFAESIEPARDFPSS